MIKILVIRHAIAFAADEYEKNLRQDVKMQNSQIDDSKRPLTEEGINKMKRNARGIRRLVPEIHTLYSSPYTRSVQTAEILAPFYLNLDIRVEKALIPTKPAEDLIKVIRDTHYLDKSSTKEQKVIAVIGHEPHLSTFIGYCICGREDSVCQMKKGGACLLVFDGPIQKGRAKMSWLLESAQLRKIKD